MNKNFVNDLSLEELRSLKKDVDERIQREDPAIERFFYFSYDNTGPNDESYARWLGHGGRNRRLIAYYYKTKNNKIFTKNNSLQDYWEISLKEFINQITKVHERIDKEDLSKIKTEILRIRRELKK
jgi:hypothetical protein